MKKIKTGVAYAFWAYVGYQAARGFASLFGDTFVLAKEKFEARKSK